MNKRVYLFFLFAIAIVLYVFERDTMFSEDIVEEKTVSTTIPVMLLLVLSLTAVLLSHKPVLKDKLSRKYSYLWFFICIISLLYSMYYPLGSRVIYGMIVLPIILFYFSSTTTQFAKSDNIIVWTITIVFLFLLYYYFNNYYNSELLNTERTTNGSYVMLYLLPFLLCHKKRHFRILAMLLTLVAIMFSLKRGGFVALLAAIVVYLLISQIGINKKRFLFWRLLLLIILSIGFYMLINYLNENVLEGFLFGRFEKDDTGSGRMTIYQKYWMMLLNSSPWHLLVGHGWQGSIRDSGIGYTCHNDFLESIVDFGIIGFILYLLLYIELIKLCKRMVRDNNEYAPAMGASIAMFFMNSMVSHILIYPKYLILFSLFWGFIVSTTPKYKVKKIIQ